MRTFLTRFSRWLVTAIILVATCATGMAQTDIDAIMMSKKNLCIGPMYGSSQWDHYWEGTFKRDNANLGTVSTRMFSVMGNYGVSSKLNLLFGVPYVWTKASQGTLAGQKGVQDLSLWAKWMPIEKEIGKNGVLSVYGLAGFSTPLSNYTPDFLPLSIGLHSTNLSLRAMADYQIGSLSATVSGTYVARSNITIDRTSYYTTSMYITNEVEMPDVNMLNIRAGYRSNWLIAEAVFNKMTTLGGFDITKNNMPFPSNRMNATSLGFNLKYTVKKISGLSLVGMGDFVIDGRNVGQSKMFSGGIFYIIDFSPRKKNQKTDNTK